ncbi:hypothetical protein [Demequina flava]|uniref:hypothetical protein n=1 Tax=Demequina flava TaxID=1095025 RepID=UPI000783D1F0|nr:hypothetical protein [Demequina flava]
MEHEYVDVTPPRPSRRERKRIRAASHDETAAADHHTFDDSNASIKHRGPRVGDPVRLLFAFGCGALIAAAVIWLYPGAAGGADESTAMPTPNLGATEDATLTDAQVATAEVYAEWEARVDAVACSAAQGYPYEPRIVTHRHHVGVVADYLGIHAEPVDSSRPVPELRDPDLYLNTYGTVDETVPGTADCPVSHHPIDETATEQIDSLIASARHDQDFLAVVAEQAWVAQHPAEVTHGFALLRPDGEEPAREDRDAQEYWGAAHEVVEAALAEEMVWVPTVRARADAFGQTTAVLADGSAVVLRVGRDDAQLGIGSYLTRVDFIRCADITVSAGVRRPWGSASDLSDVLGALATSCNALISAGFVEAETLAEVYWD